MGVGHEATLAVGPDQRIHLAWRRDGEIYYTRSSDGGETFAEPENISRTPGGIVPREPGYSQFPSLAVDAMNRAFLAWQETLTPDNDEIYLRVL